MEVKQTSPHARHTFNWGLKAAVDEVAVLLFQASLGKDIVANTPQSH
jgi:hypothetical protein